MSQVQIIANNESIDLYDSIDNEFSVTRQIHDLRDLKSRNSSFSSAFKVPNTARNIDILQVASFTESRRQTTKHDCQILMQGITIATRARLTAFYNGNDIEIQIYFGNFNIYDTLDGLLSDLYCSDLDMTWVIAGITVILGVVGARITA